MVVPGLFEQAEDIPLTEGEVDEVWDRVCEVEHTAVDGIVMAKTEFEDEKGDLEKSGRPFMRTMMG